MIELGAARTDEDFAAAETLIAEYAVQLGVDLCFQHLDAELADLRGHYGAPGCILLARAAGEPIGCVAVRPLDDGVCEMKRLYLRPAARGTGLGRRLARAAIAAARATGYRRMVLDTLETLAPALALYASLGFRATAPYYANPLPGVVYLALRLAPVDYEGLVFRSVSNSTGGDVGAETIFQYHQAGALVWATYAGGGVRFGTLLATADEGGNLDMRYQHVDASGGFKTGRCRSRPEVLSDGRLRLHEAWQWTDGAAGEGTSIIEETTP